MRAGAWRRGKIGQPAGVIAQLLGSLAVSMWSGRKKREVIKEGTFSTGSCKEPVLKVLLLGTAPPPPLAPV
jgi:hypothetical protein